VSIKSSISNISNFLHDLPLDLNNVISKTAGLQEAWDKLSPLAKNEWICWVTIVKQERTRKEHKDRMISEILEGKKRPCCWPGCPHRRKSAEKWFSKQAKVINK
jgi:hypothetical protein